MERIIEYFSRVATYPWPVVAVEFILIGLIVYWALDFLEGTRGERLFRGVIFLLLAGVLTLNLVGKQFGFERLEYLYKGFLIAVLIIAVAAFQPEIRRALIRLGQPQFLIGSSQKMVLIVEELVLATSSLSASKTGAIIVIEKKVALGEFIDTGVRLESRVSAELLKTIFWQGTPLHDMAVVIRGDKIAAARVQLPLAEAGSMDGVELGSRHRAAIGLTASSDASVIVVSEETGIVSVAHNGLLTRNVTEAQLRKHLSGTVEDSSGKSKRFWIFSKKNNNEPEKIL